METDSTQIPAALVMRLRALTGLPIMECKRCLAELPESERELWVEMREAIIDCRTRDPIEHDPAVWPHYMDAAYDAESYIDHWIQESIAAYKRAGREIPYLIAQQGVLAYREWQVIKRLLRERHGIEWRSPIEMCGGTLLDESDNPF